MAPHNKKKKKPAVNAARGFATTSVISKSKVQELEAQALDNVPESAINVDVETTPANVAPIEQPQKPDLDITNLTPEELEAKLEESELQLLVEKHAERIRKDAIRQVSRLQTERRLLRSQAEWLSLSHWLPDELVDLILSHPTAFQSEAQAAYETRSLLLSKEELSIKLWGLSKTLASLGIPTEWVQNAMHHLAQQELSGVRAFNENGKETLWGLDDALNWLAGYASHEDLPDYESGVVRSQKLPDYPTDIKFNEPKRKFSSLVR